MACTSPVDVGRRGANSIGWSRLATSAVVGFLALAASCAVACADGETGLRIHITSELLIPEELSQLSISIQPEDLPGAVDAGHRSPLLWLRDGPRGPDGGIELPIVIGVKPYGGDVDHQVLIELSGTVTTAAPCAALPAVVRRERFVRGEIRDVRIVLSCTPDRQDGGTGDGAAPDGNGAAPDGGPATPCDGPECYRELALGADFTCGLRGNGRVRCWGSNVEGVHGHGHFRPVDAPTDIEGPTVAPAFTQLVASWAHVCGLTVDGRVYCWGGNGHGQLGIGSHEWQTTPNDIGIGAVNAVAAGPDNTCALVSEGDVYCGGDNDYSLVTTDGVADVTQPAPVPDTAGAAEVVLGDDHACLRRADGTVACWGDPRRVGGGAGGAGGATVDDVTGITTAIDLAAGWLHTCAIVDGDAATPGGDIVCWGTDYLGSLLGRGDAMAPVAPDLGGAIGTPGDAVAFTAGPHHTCALRAGGTIVCFGNNRDGQLGSGSPGPSGVSELVVAGGYRSVHAGGDPYGSHTCAISNLGQVSCWGARDVGQLGDGTSQAAPTPVAVVWSSDGAPAALALGDRSSCAIDENGHLHCWGDDSQGQLGGGGQIDRPAPVYVPTIGTTPAQLSLGRDHGCFRSTAGTIACFGEGGDGRLGHGREGHSRTPILVGGLSDARSVAAGGRHTCALAGASTATWCWGANTLGEVGDPASSDDHLEPFVVPAVPTASEVVTGRAFTCLRHDGSITCWGDNQHGQLGAGTAATRGPVEVDVIADAVQVVAGRDHACARRLDAEGVDRVACWGENRNGQLGTGDRTARRTPMDVVGLPPGLTIEDLALGDEHSCALIADGRVFCWGRSDYGEAGVLSDAVLTPQQVGELPTATAIAAGAHHTCAIATGPAGIYCWGQRGHGALGDGRPALRAAPVNVSP